MKKTAILIMLFCFYLSTAQNDESTYIIRNISANTKYSNFGTTFYGSDKLVFASPVKRNFIINNTWKGNGQPYLDLYVGTITDNGELKDVEKFSDKVNTKFHEADAAFTNDKRVVYFTRNNYLDGKYRKDSTGMNRINIYKATRMSDGSWSNITSLPFNNDNYSVGHPTISKDQKTLYFISDMPGTLGKTDIFKVAINNDGTYGKPINLGPEVNTPGQEMFPYIDGNDLLYFSSNGREGLGKFDIYKSKLENGVVISTVALGEPLNSERDDIAFIINNETREGYFSSNRSGGKGDDDIYYFKEELPKEPEIIICNQSVIGFVKNSETGMVLSGALVNIYKGKTIIDSLSVKTGEDGKFEIPVECDTTYKIVGTKENYYKKSVSLITTDEDEKVHELDLLLEPDEEFIVKGDRVLLKMNNIYFDYNKSEITVESAIELNKAIEIMKKYPDLIVEFGAHCDCRGPDAYNDKLSDRRANSTVDYMLSKGISRDRLTGRGYGERMLTNKCSNGVKCSEAEHQMNRRTEFVIKNPEVLQSMYK